MWIRFIYAISTLLYTPILYIKGIRPKGKVYFAGLPFFYNKGQIIVGNKCRFLSVKTMNHVGLNHRCMITTENKDACIIIGDNCGFSGVSIWSFDRITIGNNVKVGANCLIMDGDAHQNDPRAGINAPVTICDNVWLGASVTVMKGVTIGKNSIIGINSLVTKDIPDNVIAGGNPCRVIKPLPKNVIDDLENNTK